MLLPLGVSRWWDDACIDASARWTGVPCLRHLFVVCAHPHSARVHWCAFHTLRECDAQSCEYFGSLVASIESCKRSIHVDKGRFRTRPCWFDLLPMPYSRKVLNAFTLGSLFFQRSSPLYRRPQVACGG